MECYGLNVCVPSKYMFKSNPKGDVIRRWSLGRISHEATSLMNRSVPLKKEALRDPSP